MDVTCYLHYFKVLSIFSFHWTFGATDNSVLDLTMQTVEVSFLTAYVDDVAVVVCIFKFHKARYVS